MKLRQHILGAALLLSSLFMAGCGSAEMALKSADYNRIYNEALKQYHSKHYKKAITLFDAGMNMFRNELRGDTAAFYLAKSLFFTEDYESAAEAFDFFRMNQPARSPFMEEAEYLLGVSYYNASRDPELDQSETRNAIITLNEYLNRYPSSIKKEDVKIMIEEMQQKLYDKEFINASLYFKLENYPASVAALRNAIKATPHTPYREEMMFLICQSWYNYARNSIPERKLDRYMKMVDSYYNFVGEFPDSKSHIKKLEKMFEEAKSYVDNNKNAVMGVERTRIDIDQHNETIKSLKAKIEDPATPKDEIKEARKLLKQERAALRTSKKEIKAQSKDIDKVDKTDNKEIKKTEQTESQAL